MHGLPTFVRLNAPPLVGLFLAAGLVFLLHSSDAGVIGFQKAPDLALVIVPGPDLGPGQLHRDRALAPDPQLARGAQGLVLLAPKLGQRCGLDLCAGTTGPWVFTHGRFQPPLDRSTSSWRPTSCRAWR